MGVGTLGVWSWHLVERALLTNHDDVHDFTNVVSLTSAQHQEVRLGHLVQVDGGAKQVVLKGLGKEQ